MAHAVIGGIITSTIMTLVVVPVLFTYMDALGHRASRWLLRKPPTTVVPTEANPVAKPQLGAGGSIKPVLQERNSDQ
jgi:hypothetical protein